MGTAMVNLSIQTGFERGYGVLKRLACTPLGRPEMLVSKIIAVLAVEAIQLAVLVPVAIGLGWHPSGSTRSSGSCSHRAWRPWHSVASGSPWPGCCAPK